MDSGQEICLKWNSFQSNIVTSFESLWKEEGLVDVTLASHGRCIRAHKVILSACSPFFKEVFQTNPCRHPVIILQDVHYSELESLLVFMYKGVVNIEQEKLPALLRAAETLQIRGLSGASEQVKEKIDATFGADPTAAVTPTPGRDESKTQERSIPATSAAIADPTSSSSPPPAKRKRPTSQRSQSPPPPDTPLALTPTSRPQRSGDLNHSSEPWEQPQQPDEEEDDPPEMTLHSTEPRHPLPSVSPLMPHMFLEELKEESTRADTTDDSLDSTALLQQQQPTQIQQSHTQMPLASTDTGQLKEVSTLEWNLDIENHVYDLSKANRRNDQQLGLLSSASSSSSIRASSGGAPFPCPFCERSYTSWGFRRRHVKAVHAHSQPRLSCKWCLLVLPSLLDWERHVINEHRLSSADAHQSLMILEEAHMVLQIPNPTRLDTFVTLIRNATAANKTLQEQEKNQTTFVNNNEEQEEKVNKKQMNKKKEKEDCNTTDPLDNS